MRITHEQIKKELKEYSHLEIIYREYYMLHIKDPAAAKQYIWSLPIEDRERFHFEDSDIPISFQQVSDQHGFVVLNEHVFHRNNILVYKHDRYSPLFLHKHDFYEILYVYEGHCTNTIQNTVQKLKKGDICIIPPSSPHYIAVFDDSIILNILVKIDTFNSIFTTLFHEKNPVTQFYFHTLYQREDSNYLLFHTGEDEALCTIIEKLYLETVRPFKYSLPMAQTLLGEFWVTLMRYHETDLEMYIHNKDTKINLADMLMYFQKNYSTLTLEQAAAYFNFSSPHFSKLVKRYTGQNFIQIIHHLKLENACRALAETTLSMQEICEVVGIDSQAHFSRAFKEEYGVTPTNFREQSKL